MGRLENKVALVTGAASGIGGACAVRFAREGAAVALFDLAKPGDTAWDELRAAAPAVSFHEVDVRDEDAVADAVAKAVEQHGGIDVLLNAAGVAGGGPIHALDAAEWDRVLDINLKGTFLVSKHVVANMADRQGGSVIHIASVEGLVGLEGAAAYNASKGGVVLLTRNMAIDYGRVGIRVNCLCPGFIRTPMTAALDTPGLEDMRDHLAGLHMLGRIGEPDEVAGAALFLASDDASFVTGHTLVVDGGMTAGHRIGILDDNLAPVIPVGDG